MANHDKFPLKDILPFNPRSVEAVNITATSTEGVFVPPIGAVASSMQSAFLNSTDLLNGLNDNQLEDPSYLAKAEIIVRDRIGQAASNDEKEVAAFNVGYGIFAGLALERSSEANAPLRVIGSDTVSGIVRTVLTPDTSVKRSVVPFIHTMTGLNTDQIVRGYGRRVAELIGRPSDSEVAENALSLGMIAAYAMLGGDIA